jgi:predicted small lipoprotein YifL
VPRPIISLCTRCPLAVALALALGLAGCGRKGALDPPPGGLAEPTVIGAQPAPGPDGKVAAAADPNAPPAPQPPAKKTFLLDWLIN